MQHSRQPATRWPAKAYRDEKRYWWWLPLFIAVSPIVGITLTQATGHTAYLWLTAFLWYMFLPVADFLVGRDSRNPPDESIAKLESDTYYKFVVYASIPLFYVTWLTGAWAVSTQNYGWVGYLGVSLGVALTNGLALVVGHEIGHKTNSFEKRLAQIVLAVPAYGHFSAEHNRGHHKDVATPPDPASARFGETLYSFVQRETPGAIGRAWRDEKVRLERPHDFQPHGLPPAAPLRSSRAPDPALPGAAQRQGAGAAGRLSDLLHPGVLPAAVACGDGSSSARGLRWRHHQGQHRSVEAKKILARYGVHEKAQTGS